MGSPQNLSVGFWVTFLRPEHAYMELVQTGRHVKRHPARCRGLWVKAAASPAREEGASEATPSPPTRRCPQGGAGGHASSPGGHLSLEINFLTTAKWPFI